ncbi:MAG: hypothetical protein AUI83_24235 [Armatimonadetes bacterium 13_1_40CM_3_65_7]|nr:MAG: hypothetical protein AUI83_24235 [Armatimonadetes bacterium 13_1_40CM_3_65_7]
MQEPGPAGQLRVAVQQPGHQSRQEGDLHGVRQEVLPVGVAESKPAHQFDLFRMQAVHPGLKGCPLSLFTDPLIKLALRLLHHFLDAGRVNAPVDDELLQCDLGDLATDGVKRGEGYGFGRVIDDEVDPGKPLKSADVPPLAADDPAFHVVVRQGND